MLILVLRTDKPEAEIGLYDGMDQKCYKTWHAHRQLAETLHTVIKEELEKAGNYTIHELEGIVCFKGPGSFTGLRIGLTVANTMADALRIPIVGTSGTKWADKGCTRLLDDDNDGLVMPDYGAPVHITPQKK